jgi:tetratricopeptide (TPR) repeat protein
MSETARVSDNSILETTGKILMFGVPILYFIISIAFYLKTYDSAQIKITLMQLGGTILLATWLIKLFEENSKDFFKRNIALILPLIAFLVSGIVSYVHSPLPLASANELARRVFYISFALIVVKEFDSEQKMKRLFNWLIAAAFIAAIYGVIQYFDGKFFPPNPEPGLDPFIWRQAFGPRIFSTFGNPNFFGDFLVVMSPITLALFLRTRKIHLLLLWLMMAFCVITTYSKGAWLGFGAGILIFVLAAVAFFLKTQRTRQRAILWVLTIATLLFVCGGIYKNIKGRTDSASFRIFTWLSTWEMINTHPMLGTGVGTFYVTYPAWRRPQIFFIEGRHNTETDHPEDEYLEVWYDEGIIGFGIFIWLLATLLLAGYKNLEIFSSLNNEKPGGDIRAYYQLGVLTAVSAQLVHNFVCVSLRFVSSGIFLWLLIGLIGALNAHHPMLEKSLPAVPNKLPKALKRSAQILIAAIAAYFLVVFYGYFDADMNHNMAIFFSKQGQWPQALEKYTEVIKENPSFIMAHYFMGNVYNDRWAPGDMELAIGKYKDVWKLAPVYVQSHHQAGLIYLKAGEDEKKLEDEARTKGDKKASVAHENKKKELWNSALEEFKKYSETDPIFPLNYYRMAWIYMQLGEPEKAEQTYLDHVNYPAKLLKPPHSIWVEDWAKRRAEEYAETYVNLGNLKFMQNNFDAAAGYYQKALDEYPQSINAVKNLAVLYGRQGKMDKVREMWYKAKDIAPQDPDVLRTFGQAPK